MQAEKHRRPSAANSYQQDEKESARTTSLKRKVSLGKRGKPECNVEQLHVRLAQEP
jgi:hypothetical protein